MKLVFASTATDLDANLDQRFGTLLIFCIL